MASRTTLQLGHSPDADDAFMFYALANDLIDTGRWKFEHVLQDINTLTDRATRGELEITAISVASYPKVADRYALTSCGSSMGDGYGPRFVAREPMAAEGLKGKHIAIPGTLTTSFLAAQLRLGKGVPHNQAAGSSDHGFTYTVVHFQDIPDEVAAGKFDAGLLIREGQLTFQQQGLHLVEDLGVWWQADTGLPLPLGGNCIRRDLGEQACREITTILKNSIQYSLDNRAEAVKYALQFGRGLETELADEFVGMYVNHWTIDYGERGIAAIRKLLDRGHSQGFIAQQIDLDVVYPA